MPVRSHSLPDLISRPKDLEALVELLLAEPVIGVDTESNSLYAYQEQVCLVQFSTTAADFLVDPLALVDLQPLAAIFANRQIEKVFHAAEYDLICMRRDFGFVFANLFDTMWAARVAGREAIGLSALLESEFGVSTNKRFQRADWGKRPLPKEMLEYARLDTHYLIPLRNQLYDELVSSGRWELAQEDFQRMERLYARENLNGNHPDCWERINGTRDLNPQQMAILRELCRYREEIARLYNCPVFKVMSDSTLVSIASACPVSQAELESLPGISQRQARKHGPALLKAVMDGLNSPPIEPETPLRPDQDYLTRLDLLRTWRKEQAQKMGVESDVVLPRDLLLEVVSRAPRDEQELQSLLKDVPERYVRFGDSLLGVLSKTYRRR
jgi:ribonuclease D